ncbi:MAG TPA: alkaline phosphatase family protein [Terriglobales bacterium]|nr:alkaline phosphatase family protein [Terriglobales bacterium]
MFLRRAPKRKVMVIGLDCADPDLVFSRWRSEVPNINRVIQAGVYGALRSVTPPITVPAWMCMMTGRDPGELGVYGFRNRSDYSYDKLAIANSASICEETVWDVLSRAGKECIVIGVPPTYPVKPLRGSLISCFLTPGSQSQFTYPHDLREEVQKVADEYMVDVKEFRTEKKDWLLSQIYAMTTKRFSVAKHLLKTRPWDFFMMVEMGTDRIHHGFWQFMDPKHVLHPGANPFAAAIHDYYVYLDSLVGELLDFADEHTRIMIVSDHGAKRMDGAVCLNEWLVKKGYLALKKYPSEPTRLEKLDVDWSETRAWGEGGYYGRIVVNVAGREAQGIVLPSEYDRLRRDLQQELEALCDPQGNPMGTTAVIPEDTYRETRNIAPDLSVFFGDLYWRASGTVGGGSIHTRHNDTGPDGANHDWNGLFAMAEGRDLSSTCVARSLQGLSLLDVAPTVLQTYGIAPLPGMHGTVITPKRMIATQCAS